MNHRFHTSRLIRRLAASGLALWLSFLPWSAHGDAPVAASNEVRIGVLAFLDSTATHDEWGPVLTRLQQHLPAHRFALVQLNHAGLARAVAAGELDFVITNPGHYVELESAYGISRILTLDSGKVPSVERALGSAVVALRERDDLNSLADLRGQRVAVVGVEGFGGYQLVWRELASAGLDPARHFAELLRVGLPMGGVLEAVASGAADAGIVRACMLESLPDRGAAYRVVGARSEPDFPCASSTRLYPDWPLAKLRHTPPALAKQLAVTLLGMEIGSERMAWSVPADYQSVHELFRELQIAPYAHLKEPTLMVLAERYWPWVAGFAMLIVGWILYTVRVEHLVHARTAALRTAMTERETLAQRARDAQEQADHLARLSVLGELSGTLAHELNQPLATIANYANSLTRRVDNGRITDDAVRTAATEMAAQAERAAGILGRIRGFARKRVVQRELLAPGKLASEAAELFRGMVAGATAIELVDDLPPGTRVDVDGLQIQQVLLNLLKNGADAAQGLPPERQGLRVCVAQKGSLVTLSVRDFGCGLAEGGEVHLFEPFFTTKPDGLGLGLPICRSIAEAHGGGLSAQPPADGIGMVFTLTLPVASADSDSLAHHDRSH